MERKDIAHDSSNTDEREPLPLMDCPRFAKCGVNNCPLHPAYPNLSTVESDPETKCGLSRNRRRTIARRYSGVLPWLGMTVREYAGWRSWNERTEESRAASTAAGKANLTVSASATDEKGIGAPDFQRLLSDSGAPAFEMCNSPTEQISAPESRPRPQASGTE